MAITRKVLAGDILLQVGTAAGDTIQGDVFFENATRLKDVIRGGDGADVLSAGAGQNELFGQKGDDLMILGQANTVFDAADGGNGDDTFEVLRAPGSEKRAHKVLGGNGTDTILTTFLSTGDGSLSLNARGVVKINGTTALRILDVEIFNASGNSDRLSASEGMYFLRGHEGDDTLRALDSQAIELEGGRGNDVLLGGDQNDSLYDGIFFDPEERTLPFFIDDSDTLNGGKGEDSLYSYSGDDLLEGGAKGDAFFSLLGNDRMLGGGGSDRFYFSLPDIDLVDDPTVVSRAQANLAGVFIDGGTGLDTVFLHDTFVSPSNGDLQLNLGVEIDLQADIGVELGTGGRGTFSLRNIENIVGTQRDDTLTGDGGTNLLDGGDGNDVLTGKGGTDFLFGDAGRDRLDGGKGIDNLDGGAHRDTLKGGADSDTLDGGDGRDRLSGGQGADVFVFLADDNAHDVITDFNVEEDKLMFFDFDNVTFATLSFENSNTGVHITSKDYSNLDIFLKNVFENALSADLFEFD